MLEETNYFNLVSFGKNIYIYTQIRREAHTNSDRHIYVYIYLYNVQIMKLCY